MRPTIEFDEKDLFICGLAMERLFEKIARDARRRGHARYVCFVFPAPKRQRVGF